MDRKDEKEYLINEVSRRTNIRRDVVKDIFESLTAVMISEIVNNGEFNFWRVFRVKATKVRGSKGSVGEVPDHWRLTSGLSNTVRRLWRIRFSRFNGEEGRITPDNYSEIIREDRFGHRGTSQSFQNSSNNDDGRQTDSQPPSPILDENPFLDDDDDDYE